MIAYTRFENTAITKRFNIDSSLCNGFNQCAIRGAITYHNQKIKTTQ